ncbi:MAG TPA: hypothetical protein VIJ46_04665, partial [Rhabdochlamydiaceae bacterium]
NNDFSNKFTQETTERNIFQKLSEFLGQIVVQRGYAYKDVVQPFVAIAWLKKNRLPTIRIKRNVADVAYSMLNNHWHYPRRIFPDTDCLELAMVQGLLHAERVLDSIPAQEIDFEKVIYDEEPLRSALYALYGDFPNRKVKYIDREFRRRREEIIKRRSTRHYQLILGYVWEARQTLEEKSKISKSAFLTPS